MNNWQKIYCDTYYNGKIPRGKQSKREYELLGQVGKMVIVDFPDFNGLRGLEPAHTERYFVTENLDNMPEGYISACTLASNLALWISRGYRVRTM